MASLRFATGGESHGKGILALIEGLPAGLELDIEVLDRVLAMRQSGHGRGGRASIEADRAEVLTGLKGSKTLGTPLTLWIANRDATLETLPAVTTPRPGHGDLAGCLKMECRDAREILERTSARETAGRTAAGAVVSQLLHRFGVRVFGHVTALGDVTALPPRMKEINDDLRDRREASPVRCLDPESSERMMEAVEEAGKAGDTLGGCVEVVASGLLPGLGGFDRWESRLDARLAFALMGVPSVKGVEIGAGFETSRKRGREVHDEIFYNPGLVADGKPHGFFRTSNRAGGIEGGMSNGEPVVVRAALKPIPTLAKPLKTVDLSTGRGASASTERSDVCAVPSAAIVLEAVVAFEIGRAYREKFGGDSLVEMERNHAGFVEALRGFIP